MLALHALPYKEDTAPYSEAPVLSVEWATDDSARPLPAHCDAVKQACTVHDDQDPVEGSVPSLMQWLGLPQSNATETRSGCLAHTPGRFGRLFSDGTTPDGLVPPAKLTWGDHCTYLPAQWETFLNASALLAARSDELGFMWWNEVILRQVAEEVSQAIFLLEGTPLAHEAAAEAHRQGLPLLLANSSRASNGGDLFVCAEEANDEPSPTAARQALVPQ